MISLPPSFLPSLPPTTLDILYPSYPPVLLYFNFLFSLPTFTLLARAKFLPSFLFLPSFFHSLLPDPFTIIPKGSNTIQQETLKSILLFRISATRPQTAKTCVPNTTWQTDLPSMSSARRWAPAPAPAFPQWTLLHRRRPLYIARDLLLLLDGMTVVDILTA